MDLIKTSKVLGKINEFRSKPQCPKHRSTSNRFVFHQIISEWPRCVTMACRRVHPSLMLFLGLSLLESTENEASRFHSSQEETARLRRTDTLTQGHTVELGLHTWTVTEGPACCQAQLECPWKCGRLWHHSITVSLKTSHPWQEEAF